MTHSDQNPHQGNDPRIDEQVDPQDAQQDRRDELHRAEGERAAGQGRSSQGRSEQSEGQVSEVSSFGSPGEPIYPSDAVAGYPASESGHPDEGPAGPDAVPEQNREQQVARPKDTGVPQDPDEEPERGPLPEEEEPEAPDDPEHPVVAEPAVEDPEHPVSDDPDDDPFAVPTHEPDDADDRPVMGSPDTRGGQ